MVNAKSLFSSLLLGTVLTASPLMAQQITQTEEPSVFIIQMDEPESYAMNDMDQSIAPDDSSELAMAYCYVGSVIDEDTGQTVDLYSLCPADSFDMA